ncbi:MAG: hypothetical protein J6U54_08490 [Clostridiales bacterium]|nr:hypothetical protein [Clostridiales bacterium]
MGNTIPNKVDGTLKFETEIAEASQDKVGKHPIIAKDVTTTDIPSSDVVKDWEDRNDKAVTVRRKSVFVDPYIALDFDLLGKVVTDLQEDVDVGTGVILGTLHYIDDYTGFSGDPEEQVGHFLAFKVDFDEDYDSLTVETISSGEQTLDSDKTMVLRIVKKAPFTVRAYKNDKCVSSKTYSVDQLVLEPAENP